MNGLPTKPGELVREQSQVAVSLSASEGTYTASPVEAPVITPLTFEVEINQRAGVITEVLARIMEQPKPAAFRHWGLNE